jgi:hypothetical protein
MKAMGDGTVVAYFKVLHRHFPLRIDRYYK